MKKYNHLILTRFNVVSKDWTQKPTEKWLSERIELFEEFCFPSVINQTNQHFKWLVFFDIKSPLFLRDKITQQYSKYNNFIPLFINYFDLEEVRSKIIKYLQTDFLISTRLDNDDAISVDYIEKIQRNFDFQNGVVLNFDFGYILNYRNNKLYKRFHYINAFCSLIEKSENFKTVWIKDHRELNTLYKLKRIKYKPMWLQVVHGGNLSNKVSKDSYRIAFQDTFLSRFTLPKKSIDLQQYNQNKISIYLESTKQFLPYISILVLRPLKRKFQDVYCKLIGKKVKFGH